MDTLSKKRLLVLTSTFPRWKDDTDPPFVYQLSRRLSTDFDVVVHTPHFPGSKTFEFLDGIKVHRFRYFIAPFEKLAGSIGILPTLRNNKLYYGVVPFFLIAQFFSLVFLSRRFRPDIIHAHWIIPQGFQAILLKLCFGVPVVVTAHGGDVFGLQFSLLKAMKRFVLNQADKITVVSRSVHRRVSQDVSSEKILVIPMGVSTRKFTQKQQNEEIIGKYQLGHDGILYVGRLSEKKGVRYLIEAMPMVLQEFPKARLLIVGSGELRDSLELLVEELSLQEKVYFAGGVSNEQLPGYYTSCKVFVGPSVTAKGGDAEGFGLTFVEAALSGCLLIGSDVGGIRDIVEDNITGFLVPEKDSRALAEKIIYALHNRNEVETIINKAQAKCLDKFGWKHISKQYIEVLS